MGVNETHHGCVVDIGGKGILITGKSGSGKTSLALGLIERAPVAAALVADDRVIGIASRITGRVPVRRGRERSVSNFQRTLMKKATSLHCRMNKRS